jgi:hypothetical protein
MGMLAFVEELEVDSVTSHILKKKSASHDLHEGKL